MNIWLITDSADGNMARSVGGKPYGDFIDATSSYAMVGFIFPGLGWAIYKDGGLIVPLVKIELFSLVRIHLRAILWQDCSSRK